MRKRRIACALLASSFFFAVPAGVGAAAPPSPNLALANVKLAPIASGLTRPVALAWRGSDSSRIYVAEQTGHVRIVSQGHIVGTALNVAVGSGNERGLLGLAFSRNGAKMYIDYTDTAGDIRIVEYTMNGTVANLATRRQLMQIPHRAFANHNGGNLVIGADNFLYISTGDGGGGGDSLQNGQNLGSLLGKILRINPFPSAGKAYSIPPSNPFVNQPGKLPAIYMWGLRNPWRFSLDRLTRDMWIGDVGQGAWEEIDYAAAGQSGINWGWNRREGFAPYMGGTQPPGGRDPILVRSHDDGDCAIVGGYVYRGSAIANFNGAYVFGDTCTGALRAVVEEGGQVTQSRDLLLNVPQISTFGEGPAGGIYGVSLQGTIYGLVPA
jgi:glucose/arabinose dehydrogenase